MIILKLRDMAFFKQKLKDELIQIDKLFEDLGTIYSSFVEETIDREVETFLIENRMESIINNEKLIREQIGIYESYKNRSLGGGLAESAGIPSTNIAITPPQKIDTDEFFKKWCWRKIVRNLIKRIKETKEVILEKSELSFWQEFSQSL